MCFSNGEANTLGLLVAEIYWTSGNRDDLLIWESSHDPTATAALLRSGKMEDIQTSTNRVHMPGERETYFVMVSSR
jgi:uncharacterized protein with GYD domain